MRVLTAGALGLAAAAAYAAWQATSRLADTRQADPWTAVLQQRDEAHAFTVESYGFVYRGRSGNLLDDEVLLFGLFEKERLFFMRDYLSALRTAGNPAAPVAIDVGANTGNHTLFLARLTQSVHAFEPFPPAIARLRENLALNPAIDNVIVHEVGLGDTDAVLPFVAPPGDNEGAGTFRTDAEAARRGETYDTALRIVTGDAWLAATDLSALALVKIDVEGFEEPVLKGLAQTISTHRPLVVVEISPPSLGGTVTSLDLLRGLLPERYELLAFDPRSPEAAISGDYRLGPLTADAFAEGRLIEVVAVASERSAIVPRRGSSR